MFSQAYIEQFKFSSVVAQDLLDFFLGFFPELKESCVAQREGESVTHITSSWEKVHLHPPNLFKCWIALSNYSLFLCEPTELKRYIPVPLSSPSQGWSLSGG